MSHVDDGQLNALLDGELSPAEVRDVENHLAGCAACRARLEEAKLFLAEASELLGALTPRQAQPAPMAVAPATPEHAPPPATFMPAAAGPAMPPRRTTKTAKEVAIDIDGVTHKSPAIRIPDPVRPAAAAAPEPVEAPVDDLGAYRARRWRWTPVAWAASIVLTFAVGYLANDAGRAGSPSLASRDEAAGPVPDTAPAQVAAAPASSPRRALNAPIGRVATRADTRRDPDAAGAGAVSAAPPAAPPKSALSAPAEARPLDDATRQQPPALAAAPPAAPVAPAPTADQRAERSLTPPPAAGAQGPAGLAGLAGAPMRAAEETGAPLARRAAAPVAPAFRRTDLDSAVARLSGSVRLIDGLEITRVEVGPGSLVQGAEPSLEVVRIIYRDARGRRITLDQQRLRGAPGGGLDADAGGAGLLYGDTLTTTAGGTTRIRWLDTKNFWMSLSGPLPADSLRALVERVR